MSPSETDRTIFGINERDVAFSLSIPSCATFIIEHVEAGRSIPYDAQYHTSFVNLLKFYAQENNAFDSDTR